MPRRAGRVRQVRQPPHDRSTSAATCQGAVQRDMRCSRGIGEFRANVRGGGPGGNWPPWPGGPPPRLVAARLARLTAGPPGGAAREGRRGRK